MTTIAERFIEAAETDRRRHVHLARPQAYGSTMPAYVHSYADKAGWRKEHGDRLKPGDDPLAEDRAAFWDDKKGAPTARAVSELEECERWLAEHVADHGQRRAVWAWARSKAGGRPFNAWCFGREGIHPETGRRRKDRAISLIEAKVSARTTHNDEMQGLGVLPEPPVSTHIRDTLETGVSGPTWWRAEVFSTEFDPSIRDMSWAEKRNQRRRERDARKHREQAGAV